MKHKRGYTLIEVIVAIAIISLISTISIVLFQNNNNNKDELTEVNNRILEAAKVYIAVEKDEYGNSYEYGINNGAKGLYLTVNTLVEKGYIDNNDLKTLEKNYNDSNDYTIFISNSVKQQDDNECKNNGFNFTLSWDNNNNTIYLCPYNLNTINDNNTVENIILKGLREFYKTNGASGIQIEKYKNSTNDYTYYYLGNEENNYFKYGKDKDGNDIIWRIVRFTKDNTIRLITNDGYPVYDYIFKNAFVSSDYSCITSFLDHHTSNPKEKQGMYLYGCTNSKICDTNFGYNSSCFNFKFKNNTYTYDEHFVNTDFPKQNNIDNSDANIIFIKNSLEKIIENKFQINNLIKTEDCSEKEDELKCSKSNATQDLLSKYEFIISKNLSGSSYLIDSNPIIFSNVYKQPKSNGLNDSIVSYNSNIEPYNEDFHEFKIVFELNTNISANIIKFNNIDYIHDGYSFILLFDKNVKLRPVIELSYNDTTILSGDGTQSNPYSLTN